MGDDRGGSDPEIGEVRPLPDARVQESSPRAVTRTTPALHHEWLLEAIVENIPNMIFVKDADNLAFTLFNRAGEKLLATPRSSMLGKNDYDFFPAAEAEFFQAKDRETLNAKVLVDIPEEPLPTKNGTRWLHTMKVPIVDGEGVPRYLLGISEDITERKAREAALRAAKAAADAASAELEAFAYSVAHDLRTPLRGIDGFSQALLEDYGDKLDETGHRYLGNVRQAAQRMARLIDDLLTLSRVSRSEVARERVDVTLLSRQILERLRTADPNRDVEVVVADGLETNADPRLVGVALDNLLSNAWKFTSRRKTARIEVGAIDADGDEAFFVRDDGAGFDMAYVGKLFGAFQRLHGTNEFEGTGVGLATVLRIVRRHGGRAWGEGAIDKGATFYLIFDAKQRSLPAIALDR
jgi:PAS domain S-box-containing protein